MAAITDSYSLSNPEFRAGAGAGAKVGMGERDILLAEVLDLGHEASPRESALKVYYTLDQLGMIEVLGTYGYDIAQMIAEANGHEDSPWDFLKSMPGSCGPTAETLMQLFVGSEIGLKAHEAHVAVGKIAREGSDAEVMPSDPSLAKLNATSDITSGIGARTLSTQLETSLEPMLIEITLGVGHIYVLETLPRAMTDEPFRGVIHNSFFGSYNYKEWVATGGAKVTVDVLKHLETVEAFSSSSDLSVREELLGEMFGLSHLPPLESPTLLTGTEETPDTARRCVVSWTTTSLDRSLVTTNITALLLAKNL